MSMENGMPGRRLLRALLLLTLLWATCLPGIPVVPEASPVQKFSRGRYGMVAASTPYATDAAVRLLESGGNAVDAAAAAAFALMVTDPPMTSLGGRTQMIFVRADGTAAGIDGATQAPAGVPPLAGEKDDRQGYGAVPVPGNPAALAQAVKKFGRKSLADVLAPAIELAESGYAVTPAMGTIWLSYRERFARNPGTALNYLKPDGSAYGPGEMYRNPRLAKALRQIAADGPKVFYRGKIAREIVRDVTANGGYLREKDLSSYRALPAAINRTRYRGYEIVAVGRRAWGGTLVEMLNILEQFSFGKGEPSSEETEVIARTIAQSIEDRLAVMRPSREGTAAISAEVISTREFARQRAEQIRSLLGKSAPSLGAPKVHPEPHDTTHLSVMDAEGNAVSLTTSIGPRFGTRVATPELGFIYAYSYRMHDIAQPKLRDETEMTPTVVLRNGKPFLALGAAGSERIPGAILQVISNVIDHGMNLEQAVATPRIFCQGNKLQLDARLAHSLREILSKRGFDVEMLEHTPAHHMGIVHAVEFNRDSGEFLGAADPVYDGKAAGPAAPRKKK